MSDENESQFASRPDTPPSTHFPTGLLEGRNVREARRFLKDLSVHYDRYLDSIFDRYYAWNHLESEIDEVIGNVKDHLFWPDDARLLSESFWLWRYLPGERGRLRYYLTTCAKNFARGKLRKKHPLRLTDSLPERNSGAAPPTPTQLLDNARHIRATLTEHAKEKYRRECGENSNKWRAFEMATLTGEKTPPASVAARLGITEHMVNNYCYQSRQRIMELIWLALYDMEQTDVLSDAVADIDMAVLSAIDAASREREAARRGGDGEASSDFTRVEEKERRAAKKAIAAEAADSDMVELFGFLPKTRASRKMPAR